MNLRPSKIGNALDALAQVQLNDAEQLRLAELLVQDVFTRCEPVSDMQLSTAEGYLASASHALEQARLLVESWPHDNLPVDPDYEPENRRDITAVTDAPRIPHPDDLLIQLRACLSDGRVLFESVGASRAGVRVSHPDALRAAAYVEASVLFPGRR